jgi:hypothetical protein
MPPPAAPSKPVIPPEATKREPLAANAVNEMSKEDNSKTFIIRKILFYVAAIPYFFEQHVGYIMVSRLPNVG